MKYIGRAAVTRAQNAAKNQMNGMRQGIEETMGRRTPGLEWNNYNYPPLLRLFHYSTDKLQNPILRVVRILHINFITVLVISGINLLNNIVQVGSDAAPGEHIFYSFLNVTVFAPLALFVFYSGFYGLCKRPRTGYHLLLFRITQGIQ